MASLSSGGKLAVQHCGRCHQCAFHTKPEETDNESDEQRRSRYATFHQKASLSQFSGPTDQGRNSEQEILFDWHEGNIDILGSQPEVLQMPRYFINQKKFNHDIQVIDR
jgi:hypothetical protein